MYRYTDPGYNNVQSPSKLSASEYRLLWVGGRSANLRYCHRPFCVSSGRGRRQRGCTPHLAPRRGSHRTTTQKCVYIHAQIIERIYVFWLAPCLPAARDYKWKRTATFALYAPPLEQLLGAGSFPRFSPPPRSNCEKTRHPRWYDPNNFQGGGNPPFFYARSRSNLLPSRFSLTVLRLSLGYVNGMC